MSQTKKWGEEDFWGLGYEWDPQWILTDKQKELQTKLIELSRTTLRDNAVESDKKLLFPRKNFEAIAKLGLLGLIVPKELGGMGENHVAAAMAVETIARYGCASTAMCYTMHLGAVAAACFRYHNNDTLKKVLRASTRMSTSAPSPIPTRRPARISGTRSPRAPRRSMAAGRCARRPPGPPRAVLPTGTSSRPPAPISAATTPTSPAG